MKLRSHYMKLNLFLGILMFACINKLSAQQTASQRSKELMPLIQQRVESMKQKRTPQMSQPISTGIQPGNILTGKNLTTARNLPASAHGPEYFIDRYNAMNYPYKLKFENHSVNGEKTASERRIVYYYDSENRIHLKFQD